MDAETAARLHDAACDILACVDKDSEVARSGAACFDVVIGWHKPPTPGAERSTRSSSPEKYTTSFGSAKHYPVFQSPYSWLASALVGGYGHMRGDARERDVSRILTQDPAHQELDMAFEQWVLSLHIRYTLPTGAARVSPQLSQFLASAIAFANAHQAQLPAIIDASLAPFPYTIDSTLQRVDVCPGAS